jgi:DNA-directed RNA polymerase III subunit RPC3
MSTYGVGVLTGVQVTAAVQPNFEKCNFVLRNQQLIKLAHRYIGETTSKVFGALLSALEGKMLRCYDPMSVEDPIEESTPKDAFLISPHAILNCLDPGIDLDFGLGLASTTNGVNGHSSSGPIDVSDDLLSISDSDDGPVNRTRTTTLSNTGSTRLLKMEAHLRLLQSDPRQFVKKIGREWTVPFRTITRTLIQYEIENTITARFGTVASRLVRILLKNYSTEEKTLATLAIMKPKEVRSVTNTLLQAGLLETQEIPRDNNRATNRLTWLYVYNPAQARKRLLSDSYRAMARLLRRAEVEKAKIASVIEKAERTDVIGKEDKYLNAAEMAALEKWKDVEGRLLNLTGRIDELVACLRDFSPINDAFVGNREMPVMPEA